MNVVFVEPFFPANQRQFARALAEAGAAVIGIGEYGLDALDDQLKGWLYHYERVPSVIDASLPPPGTPTQAVEAGYMANAYVRMRHPDYDALRGMLDAVGRTLHVHAS